MWRYKVSQSSASGFWTLMVSVYCSVPYWDHSSAQLQFTQQKLSSASHCCSLGFFHPDKKGSAWRWGVINLQGNYVDYTNIHYTNVFGSSPIKAKIVFESQCLLSGLSTKKLKQNVVFLITINSDWIKLKSSSLQIRSCIAYTSFLHTVKHCLSWRQLLKLLELVPDNCFH